MNEAMNEEKVKGHVIRISHEAYKRLRQIKSDNKLSFTATIEGLLISYTAVTELTRILDGPKCYRIADKVFDDVADARGYALQLAVRAESDKPALPQVLVKFGEDDGA